MMIGRAIGMGQATVARSQSLTETTNIARCLLPTIVLAVGLTLAACAGPTATSSSVPSPTQEAASWFQAINRHDLSASLAHFEPAQRHMADWDHGETPVWGHF